MSFNTQSLKPYSITQSHLKTNELPKSGETRIISSRKSTSEEREDHVSRNIDNIWRYKSSSLDKSLRGDGFSLLKTTDLASIRKIIDRRYDRQRTIIYNSEDSYIPLKAKYRDFFKNGGFRGLPGWRGHFMPDSGNTDALLIKMLQHYANNTAYLYYRLLQSNDSTTKKEFIDICIDPAVAKLLSTLNSFVLSRVTDAIDRMEAFALLEYDLKRRKKLQENKIDLGKQNRDDEWEDHKWPDLSLSDFADSYQKIVRQLSFDHDLSNRGLTKWSLTKLFCCSSCIDSDLVNPNKLTIVKDDVYRDFLFNLINDYVNKKKNAPNMSKETFALIWASFVEYNIGIGRQFDDIKKDILEVLSKPEYYKHQHRKKYEKTVKEVHLKTIKFTGKGGDVVTLNVSKF